MNLTAASIAIVALFAAASSFPAMADDWKQDHPRRVEVNKRLENQNDRIHHEVKDGQINKAQAAQLHKDDRQVRQEERDMASQDHSHITKSEQRTLNQQENGISRQIGQ